MRAEDTHVTSLLEGANQFIVPIFQRDYSWGTKHRQQLWKDVIRVGSDPKVKGHFLGPVVYVAAEDNTVTITRWLLIDGQVVDAPRGLTSPKCLCSAVGGGLTWPKVLPADGRRCSCFRTGLYSRQDHSRADQEAIPRNKGQMIPFGRAPGLRPHLLRVAASSKPPYRDKCPQQPSPVHTRPDSEL